MTATSELRPALGRRDVGSVLPDPLGDVLRDVARSLRGHVLVESGCGTVVAHAIGPGSLPPALVDTVLHRSTVALTEAVTQRRTEGVLPGGPVVRGRVADWPGDVVTVPLAQAGTRLGWLWVLLPAGSPDAQQLAQLAEQVAAACPRAADDDPDRRLLAALQGTGPLPGALTRQAAQVRVVAVGPTPEPRPVAAALRAALSRGRDWSFEVVPGDDVVHLLLLSGELPDAEAQQLVDQLLGRTGLPLGAAMSAAADPAERLDPLVSQALRALAVVEGPGRCVSVQEVRSQVVLDLLAPVLNELPDLGPDPIAPLLRGEGPRWLGPTMLAWLDLHGDTIAAAERLGVHPNTLRYRLRSAERALAADLHDPAVRLEVHLRLRLALTALADRDSSASVTG